jgi:uncharacterized protein (TIGR02453 family)
MMQGIPVETFNGFTPRSLTFLRRVKEENSKEWFEEHRREYDEVLLEPFQALVSDLSPAMLAIDPHLEVRPLIDKTVSRIYRDTRFSRDRSRYWDAMWLTFKRRRKDWTDAPGFFFELTPESYRFGAGYYAASRLTMDTFRRLIDSDPEAFLRLIAPIEGHPEITLHGDRYKRGLANPHSTEIQRWYQLKSFYLAANRKIDERLFSPELAEDVAEAFGALAPLYSFLLEVDRMRGEGDEIPPSSRCSGLIAGV